MTLVCGGRQSSRRRSALLLVTVLATIGAVLTALQASHTNAAGAVHEALPALFGAEADPNTSTSATADTVYRGTDPPVHLQLTLTAFAGALAVLVSALARRRTPVRGADCGLPSWPVRARAPSSTSAVSPMPVRRSSCVLRV
ncbi:MULTISPECIES: hypothetical protein [Rhodococcus]|uniref:hypothetical protein n=1 Tax=Rhodococcus TaxID=1827 RepID=UPI0011BE4C19|nr:MULTISPECIES: hypothetical protein [Rhodococcus]WAM15236.1 hypothetical protein OYT95_00705 [Rhodococcus sp. JS3073]